MEKAITDAVTAAVKEAVPKVVKRSVFDAVKQAVNDAVPTSINDSVPAAVSTAIPASVNTTFAAAVDQAVKEKVKEIEEAAERKLARGIKAARLEAKVSATTDLCFARYCSLGSMAPAKLDWIMRINEQDYEKIQGWNSELCKVYKEENEEKAKEREKKEQTQA